MYKYSLQSGSKKTTCPKCGKKRFVPYINNQTNEILHHTVGRCDREVNCGYHLRPKDYFNENKTLEDLSKQNNHEYSSSVNPKRSRGTNHPNHYIKRSLKATDNFTTFLHTIFSDKQVKQIVETYKIGTSTHWNNATIFWQIDDQNNIRAGKVILYNNTGHRSKYATWIHSILLKKKVITTYHLNQCLFGLHLINTNTKPIAIVESEKTACIMSIAFPKYLWLATGGSNNIADKYFTPIKNRPIILFPDLSIDNSVFDKWYQKTLELQRFGFDITTSTLLEDIATETDKQNGLDIADFFLSPPFGGFRGLVIPVPMKMGNSGTSDSSPLKELGVKTSPPFKEECPKGEVVLTKLPLPLAKSYLPSRPAKRTTILNRSALPFGKASLPKGRISTGQMGVILTKPQQTLFKMITKNPHLKNLINTFDLELKQPSKTIT